MDDQGCTKGGNDWDTALESLLVLFSARYHFPSVKQLSLTSNELSIFPHGCLLPKFWKGGGHNSENEPELIVSIK